MSLPVYLWDIFPVCGCQCNMHHAHPCCLLFSALTGLLLPADRIEQETKTSGNSNLKLQLDSINLRILNCISSPSYSLKDYPTTFEKTPTRTITFSPTFSHARVIKYTCMGYHIYDVMYTRASWSYLN